VDGFKSLVLAGTAFASAPQGNVPGKAGGASTGEDLAAVSVTRAWMRAMLGLRRGFTGAQQAR